MKLIEMDIWDLHDDPKQVDGHEYREFVIPELAYQKLKKGGVSPSETRILLKSISGDAGLSYNYANDILENRFELGEAAISTSSLYSYQYAKNVLKGRFELGELSIAKRADASLAYAVKVLEKEFKLGELAIARDGENSYEYALLVLNRRFLQGEKGCCIVH